LNNTLIGGLAGDALTDADYNVALGANALSADTLGSNSVAIGAFALRDQNFTSATDTFNVAVGYNAGGDVTTGAFNTLIGGLAGDALTTASSNTALGYQALTNTTTGASNVAVGANASWNNSTGAQNVSVGVQALNAATTASNNTAVGYQAGYNNTTGGGNTFIGNAAGLAVTTGGNNLLVGNSAGVALTTGLSNTFVGAFSNSGSGACGGAMTTGSKNTIIGGYSGNQGGLDIRTTSNNIVLSDGDGNPRGYYHGGIASPIWVFENPTTNQWVATFQNTTAGNPYGLDLDFTATSPNDTTSQFIRGQDSTANRFIIYSNGNIVNVNNSYGAISDVKLKENIIDASSQWDDIKALTVRKYSLKADNLDAPNMLGVIAQEVEAAGMGGLVYESPDLDKDMNDLGTVTKQVNYSILYMKAVKALQEAMDRIETLEAKVAALESN
jgi:hypothetical protein